MRVVVALGGNALLRRDDEVSLDAQARNVVVAARAVAAIAEDHEVVVTHGNGPQVGLLALQAEAGPAGGRTTLDVLDAESEGLVGYLLARELGNALPGRSVVSVLTQVVVAADDPAFATPTKPIGPGYDEAEARELAAARGWVVARDRDRFRRVVASPAPRAIVERDPIARLCDDGVIVVCAGGGGIPVVRDDQGKHRGVEAVVDKDRVAALLGRELGADGLLLLTDVDGVYDDFGTDHASVLRDTDPDALATRCFDAGSMGPKVEAAVTFVRTTGGIAWIGALDDAAAVVRGEAGTRVRPSSGTDRDPTSTT